MKDELPNSNPSNDAQRSEFSKAMALASTSYENTWPVGETISREEILQERRDKERLRLKYAHLLGPTPDDKTEKSK